ncbi:HET-domain-containing protein [Lophiostoma macrostomum CBS 122681]|uniref:HET-domain-containing protein n=1 Tax=Lophiostoma macrostomum CBS 122681 TaxID=1314788 RepID=A0A6A6SVV2_9PLEO|nr:HET-domain-containing protein [Lophiostoma macrostomum CBS 122681]
MLSSVPIDLCALIDEGLSIERPESHLNTADLTMIRQFLTQCSTGHESCSQASSGFMPTRLIDIQGKPATLRLIESASLGHQVRYATLSYCWGKPRPGQDCYQTTASNLADRLHVFVLAEQPPTIQDAIRVARTLDIGYLWVDALCILQGDKADWEREGSAMNNVYRNAYLTIVPAASHSVWDGFLTRTSIVNELSLVSTPDARSRSLVLGYPHPSPPSVSVRLPWYQRAWTLQELALSTRVLYFTRDAIYVECLSVRDEPTFELPSVCRPWDQVRTSRSGKKKSNALGDWLGLLEQYSSRKLTYEGDKLLAISGLANHVSEKSPSLGSYIFGNFSRKIHRGLLWTGIAESRPKRRISTMPSWAWASYPGRVTFSGEQSYVFFESNIEYVSCSPEGALTVSAKGFRARTLIADLEAFNVRTFHTGDNLSFSLDLEGDLLVDDVEAISLAHSSEPYSFEIVGILVERDIDDQRHGIQNRYSRVGWFRMRKSWLGEANLRDLYWTTQPHDITLV